MPPKNKGDVVVKVTADSSQLKSEFKAVRGYTGQWAKEVSGAAGPVDKQIAGIGKQVRSLGPLFSAIGAQGASEFGRIGKTAGSVGALLSGGLGVGAIIGLTTAVGASIYRWQQETAKAADHMHALGLELGVTSEEVDRIERAFARAGVEVDRIQAQRIAGIGRQAGLSAGEVAGLADRIQRVATLDGIDSESAAKKVLEAIGTAATDAISALDEALAKMRTVSLGSVAEQGASGLAAAERQRRSKLAEREEIREQIFKARRELEEMEARNAAARASVGDFGVTMGDLNDLKAKRLLISDLEAQFKDLDKAVGKAAETESRLASLQREWLGADSQARLKAFAAGVTKVTESIREQQAQLAKQRASSKLETDVMVAAAGHDKEAEAVARLAVALAQLAQRRKDGQISAADATRQADALAAQHKEAVAAIGRELVYRQADVALQIQRSEAELTGNIIRQVELRRDAEVAALERRKLEETALAQELGQMQVQVRRKADLEIAKLELDRRRSAEDYDRETVAIRVRGSQSELDAIKGRADEELLIVKRLEEDKTITAQQAEDRRKAIRADSARQTSELASRQTGEAFQAGAQFAAAYIHGIRGILEADDAQGVFRGILQIAAAVASIIPGGQPYAAGIAIFSGLFAEGGQVRRPRYGGAFAGGGGIGQFVRGPGTGTSDDVIIRASDGEFINTARSVRRFGVAFFEGLNRGVLDLEALPRHAAGGLVGGAKFSDYAPPPPGHSARTEIHVRSFDAVDTVAALRRMIEPAQVYRQSLRQVRV